MFYLQMIEAMISDHKNSITFLKSAELANSIAQDKSLQDEVKGVLERWEVVNKTCTENKVRLEVIETASRIFTEKLEQFVEWLDSVERNMCDVISSDVNKVNAQMILQQASSP